LKLNSSRNKIKHIGKSVFNGLHRLQFLDLSYNEIQYLDEDTFKDQGSLEVLLLNNNKIQEIPSNTFRGLYNVLHLSIEDNRIRNVSEDAFKNLYQLEYLKLSRNYLNTFNHPHHAQNVYVSYNFLVNITIHPNTRLLDVQHNNITDVKCQSENSAIEILLINNNKLYNLNCIDSFNRLKILHAGINQLQFVSKTAFQNLIHLEICNLNGNHITNIDTMTFQSQKKLIFLDMSHNRMKKLNVSNVFSNENVIEILLLGNNKIEEFDLDSFYLELGHLKLINLKGNPYNCNMDFWSNVSDFKEIQYVKDKFILDCDR